MTDPRLMSEKELNAWKNRGFVDARISDHIDALTKERDELKAEVRRLEAFKAAVVDAMGLVGSQSSHEAMIMLMRKDETDEENNLG